MHRSERTSTLVEGLATLLSDVPADPFTREIVAVPTPGIERFITQSLGLVLGTSDGHDGICAHVDFPSPAAVVDSVVAQSSGIPPDRDPWLPTRLVWPLLGVIEESSDQDWCAVITRHLAGTDRRLAVVGKLAALFDSYATQRPAMLLRWYAGQDSGLPDLDWQPHLWRALRTRIGVPSPAERLHTAALAVSTRPDSVDLPARLSLFGPTRLPTNHLHVIQALGEHREVHLWLPDASPALWSALAPEPRSSLPRRDDRSADPVQHPLLRSLGRDARELRLRLAADTDEHLPAPAPPSSLLGALQSQIRHNVTPALTDLDDSISVHSCHGQARQAEVIREVILTLLQDDPTLEPRDILVMCPDLDTFAPLLSAAFSAPDAASSVRLRIADRTPEQANDVLAVLAALMDLVTGRMELSTLLDFAGRGPVRDRFGFTDDDLERLEALSVQSGVRWGLNADHRADFKVKVPVGTWAWGMDRLLLGSVMSEDGLPVINGVLPVDDVNSGDVELVGQLAELVTRLQHLRSTMISRQPVAHWVATLIGAVDDLTRVWGANAWQYANAVATINTLGQAAGTADVDLTLSDIRWLLNDALTGRPTRANFRSGDLTVCGLAPMRSVPHRVVCLVGMDDGSFPRSTVPDGDDVLARDPQIGERDVRSEDRQALLDAIMAAEQYLVITFAGADERTNEVQPPCVPLADVLDTLDAMTAGAARARLVVAHPLQPYDARNFIEGALGVGVFSHDAGAREAAAQTRRKRRPVATMQVTDLPTEAITEVTVTELATFLTSPMADFIRRRFGTSVRSASDPPSEQIPIEINGLQKWKIGDRSLHLLDRGEPPDRVADAEWARGEVPPGALGRDTLRSLGREAEAIAERFRAARQGTARQVPVNLHLANGVRLTGAVSDLHGSSIVRGTFSRNKPRDELRMWVDLLAVCASEAGPWHGRMITKEGGFELTAPSAQRALTVLAELTDLLQRGLSSPLPLPMATAGTYAAMRREGKSPSQSLDLARAKNWQCQYGPDNEAVEVVTLFGPDVDLVDLLSEHPRADENWFEESTRFGMLGRRIWDPIIAARRWL